MYCLQRREFIRDSLLFRVTQHRWRWKHPALWLMRGLRSEGPRELCGDRIHEMTSKIALTVTRHFDYASGEKNTSYNAVAIHNNCYEFGTVKSGPAANCRHSETASMAGDDRGRSDAPASLRD